MRWSERSDAADQSVLLDPPGFWLRLPEPRKRPWINVLDLLVHAQQDVLREAKVIRLFLIENLVGRLDGRLPLRLRTMRSAVINRFVERRILVLDRVVL